jgi:hypothetical protein
VRTGDRRAFECVNDGHAFALCKRCTEVCPAAFPSKSRSRLRNGGPPPTFVSTRRRHECRHPQFFGDFRCDRFAGRRARELSMTAMVAHDVSWRRGESHSCPLAVLRCGRRKPLSCGVPGTGAECRVPRSVEKTERGGPWGDGAVPRIPSGSY